MKRLTEKSSTCIYWIGTWHWTVSLYIFYSEKCILIFFIYYWFPRIALCRTYANEHLRYQYISCTVDVNHVMLELVVISAVYWLTHIGICILCYHILLGMVFHLINLQSPGTLWPFHVIIDRRESIVFRQRLLWRTVGCKWVKGRLDWHTWLQLYWRKQTQQLINKLFLRLSIFVCYIFNNVLYACFQIIFYYLVISYQSTLPSCPFISGCLVGSWWTYSLHLYRPWLLFSLCPNRLCCSVLICHHHPSFAIDSAGGKT